MSSLTPSYTTAAQQPSTPGTVANRIAASLWSFVALLWIEIRGSQGYWLLPVMVGLGIYAPGIDDRPEIVLWPEMSLATLEAYFLLAPFAAALAAWLVDRDRRRRIRALAESMPGSGFQRDLLAFGTATFWGLAGYAGVAVWFCGQAVLRATWGGPDLGLIAAGALGIVAFTAIGVLVGRLVPGKYSPLLALGGTFVLTIGADLFTRASANGSSLPPIQLLIPYGLTRVTSPSVFHRESISFTLDVTIWMLAFIGVLLVIIALLRQRSLATGIALVATIAGAGVAAVPLIDPAFEGGPESLVPVAYTPACTVRGGFETCVHPAYEVELDDTAVYIGSLFAPVRGLEGVPGRWNQIDPMLAQTGDEYAAIQDVGNPYALLGSVASIFPLPDVEGEFSQHPASRLVVMAWLVRQAGIGLSGDGVGGFFGWPAEVPVQVRDYGNGISGYGPDDAEMAAFQREMDAALTRFAALSSQEQRAWLEANWHALRAGELTLDDLP